MSKICTSCNAENIDEAKFCRKCGSKNFQNRTNKEDLRDKTQKNNPSTNNNFLGIALKIIIIFLIIIILVGAIVANLLISKEEKKDNSVQHNLVQNKESIKPKDSSKKLSEIGILYPLDTFTVSLKSNAGRRYLKVTMSLEIEGQNLSLELDAKTAVMRDRIIRILSSKTLEKISTKQGKSNVSNEIMETLNAMLADGKIIGIYFTEFAVQ